MINFTTEPIDFTQVTDSVRSHAAGAVVLFLGTVREFTGDVQTSSLEYDAYPDMALQELRRLETVVREKWPVIEVSLVHRTGALQLGDIAVAVAVSSRHRHEAFEAGQWLIDTLKDRVPVWKKEIYANGRTEWVHPPGLADGVLPGSESDFSGAES
ncbi:MAG: molybdenum cofactor biosynthesis protein MoaE [Fuerstiella sp.]|nr:molybdenum cofactor biosynthesis protein MoaE [Fuerstiella sp.]MCP4782184.1 molybdenum cofactor biosynthesis protein MoaE [Fuerstiella sp.]MCP4859450.1 molybdenum cofactor biosynthesis protein MoaE [Fuerstiella sp.]